MEPTKVDAPPPRASDVGLFARRGGARRLVVAGRAAVLVTTGADVWTGGDIAGGEDATRGGRGGSAGAEGGANAAGCGGPGSGGGALLSKLDGPGRNEATLLLLQLPPATELPATRPVIMSSAALVDTGGNVKRDAVAAWCDESTGSDILRFFGGGLGALQ